MIYFAQPVHGGPVRIGVSGDLARRKKSLGTWMPGGVEFVAQIDGWMMGEAFLHAAFSPIRIERDWFRACSAMWRLLIEIEEGGRPWWLPAEIDESPLYSFDEILRVFGDAESAVSALGYGNPTALRQSLGHTSRSSWRTPGRVEFHRALKVGLVPDYIAALHVPLREGARA